MESRDRARRLVEELDAILWEADVASGGGEAESDAPLIRLTFVSRHAEAVLGYPVEQWLGEPDFLWRRIHDEDRNMVLSAYRAAVQEGLHCNIEYRLLSGDGRVVWVRDRIKAESDDAGKVRRLHGVMVETTELRLAEEALKQSAESYRAFVEQSSEGIWCYTAEPAMPVTLSEDEQIDFFYGGGRLTECNAAFARMYGFERPEELIGARVGDLLPRSDPHNIEYLLSFIRSGYRLVDAESHEVDRDGRPRYLLNNLVGIVESDQLMRVWGTQRDITEKRAAEEQIGRQTAFFQQLFESSPNAILLVDTDDVIRQANRGFERLFQYSVEEVVGRHVNDLIVPEDRAEEASTLSRHALNGEIARRESVRKRKDGSLLTVSILGYPIHIGGRQEGLYAIYTDITERVRANAAIREIVDGVSAGTGKAFFRSLVQHLTRTLEVDYALVAAPVGGSKNRLATLAIAERGVLRENTEYDLIGAPCEQVIGREIRYFPTGVRNMFPADEHIARLGVESYMGVPLFDSESQSLGVLNVMHRGPIAYEQLARSILRIFAVRAAAELERMRSEDALRRSEEQLRHSQKMEAVGRLAGGIAHDFNNLLTAISGYSDLILVRMSPRDPLRRQVEEIRKAGERAASLTRQLLALSRKQMLQPKVLDLNVVVAEMDKMLRRLIGEDVDLRTLLQPGLARVKADPSQIEQVILNLAINARDAMPHGGLLTIETTTFNKKELRPCMASDMMYGPTGASEGRGQCELLDASEEQFVMLAISDTGIGMGPDVYGHLFEPFFTTKEKGKGTGLGLSTVYGIVKQSNGHICVSTEPGRGTTIRICLPTVEGDHEHHPIGPLGTGMMSGTETILLVEDEEVVRKMTKEILESCGYTVLVAADGAEAISIAGTCTADLKLLLTDVVMPGMNGYELAKRLTAVRPEMRVLYISGHAGDAMLGPAALRPGAAFLPKPFAPDRLAQAVRELLDLRLER